MDFAGDNQRHGTTETEVELERRHRFGYAEKPVEPGEFGDLTDEPVWPPADEDQLSG